MGNGIWWKPEEDAILYANPEKTGAQLVGIIPGRSAKAITSRRSLLGLTDKEHASGMQCGEDHFARPLAEESAYHIRADYAAKIKIGYTHEQAVKWLVEANSRHREIIEDVLTNPKYNAEIARCRRKVKREYEE